MKTGHCKKCVKYDHCIEPCRLVNKELDRIERGRHKRSIEIEYQSTMTGGELRRFDNAIYGAFQGE